MHDAIAKHCLREGAASARRTFLAVACTFPSSRLTVLAGPLEAQIDLKMCVHVSR